MTNTHIAPTIRVNGIAQVDNNPLNPRLCINTSSFTSVNIKHLLLIVCVGVGGGVVCTGHNCDSVHGSNESEHVSGFHTDVCSVWKILKSRSGEKNNPRY